MRPKTKIIATLGPSSTSESIIRRMMKAGLDIVRLNFSHGTHQEHRRRIGIVRKLNAVLGRRIRILGDLEGHRIRIGELKDHKPLELKKGTVFWLSQENIAGEGSVAPFDYEGPIGDIKKGLHIYIDDGTIDLQVIAVSKKTVKTRVIAGALLKEHKGINIPGARLRFARLTLQDKTDIEFAVEERLDFIAQSFVRTKRDVEEVSTRVRGRLPGCGIIAKIENREGIANIDGIIKASDGIMIARGDMGVSIPIYEVPIIQKEIIAKCNRNKKFVITATQMLEHMTEDRIPTRAEVTDVANAVLDGSDAVMLSAETASGLYPVEAVAMMNRIIAFTESSAYYRRRARNV